jgi:hypothetical protein
MEEAIAELINMTRVSIALVLVLVVGVGCKSYLSKLSFDTSYSPPADWKIVQDGKWGLQFHVPSSVNVEGHMDNPRWIHEGTNLRVIVDFGGKFAQESLRQRKNYVEARMNFNGLDALVCSYDDDASRGDQPFPKRMALYFLKSRNTVAPGREPSFVVEYASDRERTTALRILQTVRFFNS